MSTNKESSLVDYVVVRNHLIAFIFYLVVVILTGLSYSMQFLKKYPFPGIELLSPGRVRMCHTQGIAFGMLANGLLAVLYYIVPKLTNFPTPSQAFGRFGFWLYNALVMGCVVLTLAGYAQGVVWAETPKVLDPFIALAVTAVFINLMIPIWKAREKPYYVSLWYAMAAMIWTPIVYLMGNFLPEYVFAGISGATITSMYIHDLVGLFVTPIGIAAVYYLLPAVMRVPIYSHALSIIGFWGLAFFYPLNSAHHYLYSPIPMWAQYASIVASIGVHVVVYTVVFNVFATISQDWGQLRTNLPVRWIFMGTLAYLITCIQCAIQVTLAAQEIIHFTDWVVGHAHFVLFGTFTFWVTAWVYWLLPRIWRTPIYSESLARWHFWLATLGIVIMQVDLLAAGVVQGYTWRSLVPFIDSVRVSVPFWWVRSFSGVMILVSETCFVVNIYMTWRESRRNAAQPQGTLQAQGDAT